MLNKKNIILAAIILLLVVIVFLFIWCPRKPTISIISLYPANNEPNASSRVMPQVVFDGKVEEKDIIFTVSPDTKLKKLFKENDGKTAVYLIPDEDKLKDGTEYQITLKSSKRCSQIKELARRSYVWKFKTATFEYLINQQDKEEGEMYIKNPLAKFLPYQNKEFQILFVEAQESYYKITLYVNRKPSEDDKEYNSRLKKYRQDALDWIKNKGINPDELNIMWDSK